MPSFAVVQGKAHSDLFDCLYRHCGQGESVPPESDSLAKPLSLVCASVKNRSD